MCTLLIESTITVDTLLSPHTGIPLGNMLVCVISLLPLHWLNNSICLSWAFFPFTHSLCRVARQISIIHKQLSYLPQQTTRVFVYRFKINNLHSWLCSEHLSGRTAFHLELEPGVLFGKIADVYKWALEKLIKYWDFELSWEFQKKEMECFSFHSGIAKCTSNHKTSKQIVFIQFKLFDQLRRCSC